MEEFYDYKNYYYIFIIIIIYQRIDINPVFNQEHLKIPF
jgi:hypothetical protein